MISVLMPAYNCEQFVAAAISSILGQSHTDWELIIVNDGSADATQDVIMSFNDSRIRYFRNDTNRGLAYTRNRLLSLAEGDMVAFLDSDDIAERNRLKVELSVLQSDPDIDFVAASVRSLDENGMTEEKNWRFDLDKSALPAHLLFYNPVVTSTVLFRKAILPEEKFREDYPPCEDYDLWTRILRRHKGVVLPDILGTYRLYHNSVSKRKAEEAVQHRNKVVVDQLDLYFKGEYIPDEREIHLSLVEFSLKNDIRDIPEIMRWVQKLIALNRTCNHFEEQILKQVLYERVLKKWLRLSSYDYSVYRSLRQLKKELQPVLTVELRKKEMAIFVFSILNRKLISL